MSVIVHPSASYSITMRVRLPERAGTFARVATAIGSTGANLGAIDLVRVEGATKLRDITVACIDAVHSDSVVAAVREVEGVTVEHVVDRTFQLHEGGKIQVTPSVPVKTRDDLSMAYTPGVARVCTAIHVEPERAWSLTIKGNTVAVVTDGTAVLGLGDIGPEAAMPVMEGKALLFKEFAGVDAFPLCLATTNIDEIVAFVAAAAPTFGGINLEDIAAPRCAVPGVLQRISADPRSARPRARSRSQPRPRNTGWKERVMHQVSWRRVAPASTAVLALAAAGCGSDNPPRAAAPRRVATRKRTRFRPAVRRIGRCSASRCPTRSIRTTSPCARASSTTPRRPAST
jgi:hypothetical protein